MALQKHLVAALFGMSAVAGLWAILNALGLRSATNGSVVAEPQRAKILAKAEQSTVETRYRITNRTGQPVQLGPASTSCGCSVAAIEPQLLEPGRSATVTVKAQPLEAGERTVQIALATSAPAQPELRLQLTIVGAGTPPFVVAKSGPIHFGAIRQVPAEEHSYIETQERSGSPIWITGAETTVSGISLVGGLESEAPVSGGLVHRRYSYRAVLSERPQPGRELDGKVRLVSGDEDRMATAVVLPIDGTVRPAVSVSPGTLIGSFADGERSEPTFMIGADDPGFVLEAETVSESAEDLDVHPAGRAGGQLVFRVTPHEPLEHPIETTLRLRTNHPDAPEVSLPLAMRPIR